MNYSQLLRRSYFTSLCCILLSFGTITISKAQDKTIATPEFSAEHGFYENAFDLQITSKSAGASIKYTLDGSDPRTSNSARLSGSPATVKVDPTSKNGRGVTPGVVVRAYGYRDGYIASKVITKTYIFIEAVKTQAYPGHDWPELPINSHVLDYAVDQEITVNSAEYAPLFNNALLDIPTISIVTDNKCLFSSDSGIYVNPRGRGRYWERSASVELINPDNSKGFQIDAGLRIRGGYSRQQYNPKHAFRLFFRAEYGESKLNYPLFEDEGVSEFDNVDLRTSQNYSWSYDQGGGSKNTLVREVFSRDLQREMGQPYTRSRDYHLYVNGLYWGLYQTQERSEASYAESYFGGDKEDYDVIKVNTVDNYILEAADGNMDAWNRLYAMSMQGFNTDEAYYKVQGLNMDGTRNKDYEKLLDIDNLLDYMINTFYVGDGDGPVSWFLNEQSPNNFFAIYNREDPDGFKFFRHDAEHSLGALASVNDDRTGPYPAGSQSVNKSNPMWFHQQLVAHSDYVARFADRANNYFLSHGILTPDSVIALLQPRINTIENAVIGESARWGDAQRTPSYTKQDWQDEIDRLTNEYVPLRTQIVLDQFKAKGWFTDLVSPEFKIANADVFDDELEINGLVSLAIKNTNGKGSILYTTTGADPRLKNGATSTDAVKSTNSEVSININETTILRARILNGTTWSALKQIKLIKQVDYADIIISEIHYNPTDMGEIDGGLLEFVELKNTGENPINLTLCSFNKGINFTFNNQTIIGAGEYIVIASNIEKFKLRYSNIKPAGEYIGQLNNSGETITLVSPFGSEIISVKYSDIKPWPKIADGAGFSLVTSDDITGTNPNLPEYWAASSTIYGTPGSANLATSVLAVLVNEINSRSEFPEVDAVELYNPNNTEVNIGNWYLTDNFKKPTKWQIPVDTKIPANGYLVLNQGHYVGQNLEFASNEFGNDFSFSSHGESVYLFSASATGSLTGYVHGYDFDATDLQLTFGRYVTSQNEEHFVLQQNASLGNVNSLPNAGPIVINKIMYNPTTEGCEFIELLNSSNGIVNLFDPTGKAANWNIKGIDFDFPDSISLLPNASMYLISSEFTVNEFKSAYALGADVQVLTFNGKLKNDNETISIIRPSAPYIDGNDTLVDDYLVDKVGYSDEQPWPIADGNGFYLQKIDKTLYGNDPINWTTNTNGLAIAFDAPKATEMVMYYAKLKAVSGQAPFTWRILTGALPENMTLDSITGEIYGISSQIGISEITVSVTDANTNSVSDIIAIEVMANNAPIAVADAAKISQNMASYIDVLSNDIDTDGDKYNWTISVSREPQNGTATIDTLTKSIFYTPSVNFYGNDTIEYQLSHLGKTSNAIVSITIEPFNEGDFNALVAIYKALDGDNWVDKTGWNTEINNVSNNWFGVEVANGRVVGLQLVSNSLKGAIPPEIGNLTELQYLYIIDNPNISGSIPPEIGNLTKLNVFYFYYNTKLSGEIPAEIGNLTNIQFFILANCDISGPIPEELGNLKNTYQFYLFNTNVTGDLPDGFADMTNLSTLWLINNHLTGIPDLTGLTFDEPDYSNYIGFSVSGNNLLFDDIKLNLSVLPNSASYSPQKIVEILPDTVLVGIGGELSLTFELEGVNNEYQWFKGANATSEKSSSPDFYIANITDDDLGKYRCKITDQDVPNLTLTTNNVNVLADPTSIKNLNSSNVRIFANHKTVHFTSFNGADIKGYAEIYDVSGKLLLSKYLSNKNNNTIETQNLEGAYIVRLIAKDRIYTEKVILR